MLFYVKVHKAYSALRGVRRACGQRLYGDMQHLLRFLRRAAKMENSIRKTGFYINISECAYRLNAADYKILFKKSAVLDSRSATMISENAGGHWHGARREHHV